MLRFRQGAGAGDLLMKRFLRVAIPYAVAAAVPGVRRRRGWLAAPAFALAVAATASASAQAPVRIIEGFGLLGAWAEDCNAEPSAANPYAIFQLTLRGNVELRNDFGPDYDEMVYRVVAAQRLSYFRLELRQLLTTDDQIALNVVMMRANGRIRVWSSHASDGSIFVENGAVPSANNRETGWMERCNIKWTGATQPMRGMRIREHG
jgi:hypothetical protein